MKIKFYNKTYELFFRNKLLLQTALNYADEDFFNEFEKLCGGRYRILSIIKNGEQQKFALVLDLDKLKKIFAMRAKDEKWPKKLLRSYSDKRKELLKLLSDISRKNYYKYKLVELSDDLMRIRKSSVTLDASSNMLHIFSSLVGNELYANLKSYSKDEKLINKNFVFYTLPINKKPIKNKTIFKLTKKDRILSEILRVGAYIKDDDSKLLYLRKKIINNLNNKISKFLSCSSEDLEYLTIEEIREGLRGKLNIETSINNRKMATVLFYDNKRLKILDGKNAVSFLKKGKIKEVLTDKKEKKITGQIASLGKATGKVKVCFSGDEANKKIKKGDILVTIYTDVDFVPAMKKAGAIVTETGGITSHAAVISRELGIPCVIAVKDATKVLKDGDLVEVDADKGIIKIINK